MTVPRKKVRTLTALLVTLIVLPALEAPAMAETIRLKNGTMYKGKIVNQTLDAFSLQMPGDNGTVIAVPKSLVDIVPPPDPTISQLLGHAFPGAGQVYLGDVPRAAFYFILAGAMAGVGYWAGTSMGNPGLAVGLSLSGALMPWTLGAVDAKRTAEELGRETRYDIRY